MGPRAGPHILDKTKISPLLGFEPRAVHSTAYPLRGLRYPAHVQIMLQCHKGLQNNLSGPSITLDLCVSERADKIIESVDCFTLHSKWPSSDQSDLLTQFISVTCRLLSLHLATNTTINYHNTRTPRSLLLASDSSNSFLRLRHPTFSEGRLVITA